MKSVFQLCLTLILFLNVLSPASAQQPLKIGAVLPLTASTSVVGLELRNGLDFCIADTKSLYYEDSQAQPALGVAGFNKLVHADGIGLGIIALSGISAAVIPVAAANKVPLILTIVSARSVAKEAAGDVFRFFTSGEQEGPIFARYIATMPSLDTAAVLYLEDEYGAAYQKAFSETFAASGGRVVASESFARTSTDYRTQLTKIRSLAPKVIYIIGHEAHIVAGMRQARELGIKATLSSNWLLASPAVRAGNDALIEGALFTAPEFLFSSDPRVLQFKQDYRARFGAEPTAYAALGCDTAKLINGYGAQGAAKLVRDLRKLKGYKGLLGELNAAADGSIEFSLYPATFKDGAVKRLE